MTVIEKVARAHHAAMSDVPWSKVIPALKRRRLAGARAALEALRSPTDAMRRGAMESAFRMDGIGKHYQTGILDCTMVIDVDSLWASMIQCALDEGK